MCATANANSKAQKGKRATIELRGSSQSPVTGDQLAAGPDRTGETQRCC